ncbi:MAG: GNAT family N-acetyltransferase [Chloroflexota bacterium]|nr:GNAT family N-acetyltransferase [Chloroflexota bacterium]
MIAPGAEPLPDGVPAGAIPVSIEPLNAADDEAAAAVLASCTREGTLAAGRALVARVRSDPDAELYALAFEGQVLFAYVLRQASMSMELTHIAVAPSLRRQGLGRATLADAIRRAGARPLVAEVDEAALPFFKACGFKLFGKRKAPDGTTRYRLGAHAPRPRPVSTSKEGA